MPKTKPAEDRIESVERAWAALLRRPKLWRYLWAFEAAKATLEECCAGAGLTADEFNYVRAAAYRFERFG